MCDPVSLALLSMGLGAIGSGQQQIAKNEQATAEIKAARAAAVSDYSQLMLQQNQINDQSRLEMVERAKQNMRQRASLSSAMAEAGISGNSAAREMVLADQEAAWDTSIIEANRQNRIRQNITDQESVYSNQVSRINVAKSQIKNPWLAGLEGLLGGLPGLGSALSK